MFTEFKTISNVVNLTNYILMTLTLDRFYRYVSVERQNSTVIA